MELIICNNCDKKSPLMYEVKKNGCHEEYLCTHCAIDWKSTNIAPIQGNLCTHCNHSSRNAPSRNAPSRNNPLRNIYCSRCTSNQVSHEVKKNASHCSYLCQPCTYNWMGYSITSISIVPTTFSCYYCNKCVELRKGEKWEHNDSIICPPCNEYEQIYQRGAVAHIADICKKKCIVDNGEICRNCNLNDSYVWKTTKYIRS